MDPLISIVIATFNRSGILRYSIRSVLRQTYPNWELIVVGDHCTDDTQDVVASFQDQRIRFFNLPVRHGEQSAPNNFGVQQACGELIAFLNHDDLWLESHLERCSRLLLETDSDLVYGLSVNIEPDGRLILVNANLQQRYSPMMIVPASTWCMKRSLHMELNGWRSGSALYNAPSQDFLFRAWKLKKKLTLSPELTAVLIPSGCRKNSYIDTNELEHSSFFNRSQDPDKFRSEMLTVVALTEQSNYLRTYPFVFFAVRLFKNAVNGLFSIAGLHPNAVQNFLKFGKKGGLIEWLRIQRGLPKKEQQI
jgi:glycosyltransferase involved in cell wall biosynthesis